MKIDYKTSALLAVDIQNDFCPAYTGQNEKKHPKGALAIAKGDNIIAPLNRVSLHFHQNGGKVLATQDWHPKNHISFAASHKDNREGDIILISVPEDVIDNFYKQFPDLTDPVAAAMQQVLWPVHCVQNTEGAAFHDELNVSLIDFVFRKGYRKNIDSYSAFFENDRCTPTDLYGYLKKANINTLIIGGLATDYCVLYTVTDARRLGFDTFVLEDACMGIDIPAGSIENAKKYMEDRGAVFISTAVFA